VSSSPAAAYYSIGAIEILLGLVLIVGFLRKPVYIVGILYSLMIWGVAEGFGGPYGPGSTDIGTAVIYAFVFVAMIIAEKSAKFGDYSLDALIIRRWNNWKRLSEL
jgi:nitrite reductase (NO-forming)